MMIQDLQYFPNKPNWALRVKHLLSMYGFGNVWEAQGVQNVLQCGIYKDLRKQYIAKYFWVRPNMLKFIQLFSSERQKTICNLAIFVEKAFKQIMSMIKC